jgi:hypothetical protein
MALPFTLKIILRQKKNYGNSNSSPCKNIIFKKSSKKNQNPSTYIITSYLISRLIIYILVQNLSLKDKVYEFLPLAPYKSPYPLFQWYPQSTEILLNPRFSI